VGQILINKGAKKNGLVMPKMIHFSLQIPLIEILIMFNEKPNIQTSNIITHNVSRFLDEISFY